MKRRKQSIKFRPKYAGRVAKEWSRVAIRTTIGASIVIAVIASLFAVRHIWSQSDAFKIREVILQGDIPKGLEHNLPFDRQANMWMLRPSNAEREILNTYPEMRTVAVRRSWSRNVVITGHYREPLAWYTEKGKTRFIDKGNVTFDLPSGSVDAAHLPELQWGSEQDRQPLLDAVIFWAGKHTSFSALITKCETDTIHRMQVKLADGTVVDWGDINDAALDVRTRRLKTVMEKYHPVKTPAKLLFVTDDRLVMDSNWGGN